MKKFKSLKLMLLGVLVMGSMNAFADGELTNGTLKFILEGGKATITGFAKDQAAADLVIPNKIKNSADGKEYTVGKVQDKAFLGDKGKIETIDLQAGEVKNITANMFSGLSKLKSIKLGGSVESIAAGAFAGTALEDLDLSKTKVATIYNLFNSSEAYTVEDITLDTNTKVYNENVKLAGNDAVKKNDPIYSSPILYTEEQAADFNKNLPGHINAGDPLLYTKASANEYNQTVFPTYGAKVAGETVKYTAKTAAAKNATLPGHLTANQPLTYNEARVFNDYVTGLSDAEAKQAILLFNSKLPGARTVNPDGAVEVAFANSGQAYDWNKAAFGDDPEFVLSPTYTAGEAEAWNEAHAAEIEKNPSLKKAVDQKKDEAYYTEDEATKFNTDNAAAIAAGEMLAVNKGDLKPGYAKNLLKATEAHQATYGKGAAVKGDMKYAADQAGANNFNVTLKGAYTTDASGIANYKKDIANKKEGDFLTAVEVNSYNATLDGAVSVGADVIDEKTNDPVVFNDETAYAYNEELAAENGYKFVAAGSKTGATATKETAAEYNASLPGAVKANDPDYVKDYARESEESANTKNVAIIEGNGDTPYKLGDVIKGHKEAAKQYKSLTQVKLPSAWETIATKTVEGADRVIGAFEGCNNLATVDFGGNPANQKITKKTTGKNADKVITVGKYAFLGTALTAIDLSKTNVDAIPATFIVDGNYVATNNSLESVALNPYISQIPGGIFADCKKLATVTFPTDDQQLTKEQKDNGEQSEYSKAVIMDGSSVVYKPTFTSIGSKAFANTAIASFRLPATATADGKEYDIIPTEDASSPCVDDNAFSGCTSLKEFTFVPASITPDQEVDDMAFPGCKDVAFKTTHAYQTTNPTAPKNSKYELFVAGYQTEFKTTEFKKTPGKYYIKYYATKDIKVKKDEAKVYNAYLDAANYTLNMCLYKATAGYYEIDPGATVLIITNKKDLQFEDGTSTLNGSWLLYEDWTTTGTPASTYDNTNALKIVMNEEGVSRTDLDAEAGADKVVYGWVNSATAGTGFQKITTGKTFNAGTMYVLAAEPKEESARLIVRWLDENGNIDAEATGIKKIDAEAADSEAIFNLQGVRVNGAQKGVFIKNGKKYVK